MKITNHKVSVKHSKFKDDAWSKGYRAGNSVALTTQTIS